MNLIRGIYIAFVCLLGCSGMEQSEQDKLRRLNSKGEFIHRKSGEKEYPVLEPVHWVREPYPWEKQSVGRHPRITKELFRCKGSSANPPHVDPKNPTSVAAYFDCGGFQKHSLPLREGQEFIYPILIDLLNEVQEQTGHKVVITCAHRCPVHNAYVDPKNSNSKHLIGAEVDFYVQGMEEKADDVVRCLMSHYKGEKFKKPQEREWTNGEILIKLYTKTEGRDLDNRHPYPYITIQVQKERETGNSVIATPERVLQYQRFY